MRNPFGTDKLIRKRTMFGLVFLIPWLIGFLLFFCYPLIHAAVISFQKVAFLPGGGLSAQWVGLDNFVSALTRDENFIRYAAQSVLDLLVNVPVCLVFSFFVAVLLHQKFHGNFIVKTIFFLPVILGTGLFLSVNGQFANDTAVQGAMEEGANSLGFLQSMNIVNMLNDIGIPASMTDYITGPVDRIYSVISMSSIQIFVFLAGLNSISDSLYEAAYVEGANGWTSFWKITFPLVSPVMIINVVYSLIDNFTMSTNVTMNYAWDVSFKNFDLGLAGAMMWVYCLMLTAIVGVAVLLISKRVVYQS